MTHALFQSRALTAPHGFTNGIEGPACDALGNLYVCNFSRDGTIGIVTPEGQCSVLLELPRGSIASGIRVTNSGHLLINDYARHHVFIADPRTRLVETYIFHADFHQPNDLALDDQDTIYLTDPDWHHASGRIWRVDSKRRLVLLEDNMGTTNGIEVSPNNRRLYVNETVQRRVWAYDLAPEGNIRNKRLLIEFPDFQLDGMRCDIEGNLYITRYGKGTVAVVAPNGKLLREVQLHGKQCSNVTFGGPDGCTCYVTVVDNGNIEWFRTELPGRETSHGTKLWALT